MTAAERAPTTHRTDVARPSAAVRALATLGTIVIVVMIAVLPLLTPLFVHAGIDASDAAARLGVAPSVAHRMSDLSVEELVLGPGTFDFSGPDGTAFYDISERSHLRDARTILWIFLAIGSISLVLIAAAIMRATPGGRASLWRAISIGGATTAVGIIVLGLISLVAFSTVFTLFHQVFFPGGNWAFDPTTQRLVQLYPFAFWQITAGALGFGVAAVGTATWFVGRRMAGRSVREARG